MDAETRERLDLRGRARLTNYLTAASRGRMADGAEAELAQAAGVNGIPLELFEPDPRAELRNAENRAVTPAPGTVSINLDPIRPAVFSNSIAARLGIDMPRVMSGTYVSATITTSQTAAALDKAPHADAAAVATAGALTVTTATPKRISARLELALEDIAAVGQENFESILRQESLARAVRPARRPSHQRRRGCAKFEGDVCQPHQPGRSGRGRRDLRPDDRDFRRWR